MAVLLKRMKKSDLTVRETMSMDVELIRGGGGKVLLTERGVGWGVAIVAVLLFISLDTAELVGDNDVFCESCGCG